MVRKSCRCCWWIQISFSPAYHPQCVISPAVSIMDSLLALRPLLPLMDARFPSLCCASRGGAVFAPAPWPCSPSTWQCDLPTSRMDK